MTSAADAIERAEQDSRWFAENTDGHIPAVSDEHRIILAAEVKRLRVQVEELESERAVWISEAGEAESEVDRLRAAVEALTKRWEAIPAQLLVDTLNRAALSSGEVQP